MRHEDPKKNWDSVTKEQGEIDYYSFIFMFANLIGERVPHCCFTFHVCRSPPTLCCGTSASDGGGFFTLCGLLMDYELLKDKESVILTLASSELSRCCINVS